MELRLSLIISLMALLLGCNKHIDDVVPDTSTSHPIEWTSSNEINDCIKEFYIPSVNDYGQRLFVKKIVVDDKGFQVRITNEKESLYLIASATFLNSNDYYKYNPITPLYLAIKDSREIIGYIMFNYNGQGINTMGSVLLNNSEVKNADNSPTIFKTINSEEQIVLIGDSLFGFNLDQESLDKESNANNVLADLLMGLTHKMVLNCGFGGCSMAHRKQSRLDIYYDRFSFSDIMLALSNKNFDLQEEANIKLNGIFYKQLSFIKHVDFSKKVTFLVSYLGNDVNLDIPIGNLWNFGETQKDWDVYTYLGAMNKGIDYILSSHPLVNLSFITGNYKIRNIGTTENPIFVAPYDYKTPSGQLWLDYYEKLKENSQRIGVRYLDMYSWGVKNAYTAYDKITVDGSHFTTYGYYMFAKWLIDETSMYY